MDYFENDYQISCIRILRINNNYTNNNETEHTADLIKIRYRTVMMAVRKKS